jgi:hypothetical protein
MNFALAKVFTTLVCALACVTAVGASSIEHVGSNNPMAEGFFTSVYKNDSTEGPISNDLGHAAWSIANLDTVSQFSYTTGPLSAVEKADIAADGFTLTLVARVLSGVSPAPYTASQPIVLGGADYDNGSVRWEIYLGLDAQNDIVVVLPTSINNAGPGNSILATGPSYTLKGLGDGYNTYQLISEPKTSVASLYVNGVEVLRNYTGETTFVSDGGLGFFAFSGGHGNFSLVQLATAAEIPTTTTLTVTPTSGPEGAPISLTAQVAASGTTPTGGTVTFKVGTKTLGKVTLNATGQATLTSNSLPVGTDSIVAVYSGSAQFASSTSATLKVTITEAPVVSFAPSSVTFPSTIVGTVSDDQVVTLTNAGSSPLAIKSIGVTGGGATSFLDISTCGGSLAVGKSCAIYVGFAPKKPGSETASLSVADNATGSPQTVTLTGTGVAAKALTLAPTTLVFPATAVGGSSEGQSVQLTNSGTAVVAITSITLTGADPSDFVTLSNCGADLLAGASCTALVAFSPTAAGQRTGTLSVTDDASASPQVVTLSGTGK